jgi:hypothetical protein
MFISVVLNSSCIGKKNNIATNNIQNDSCRSQYFICKKLEKAITKVVTINIHSLSKIPLGEI